MKFETVHPAVVVHHRIVCEANPAVFTDCKLEPGVSKLVSHISNISVAFSGCVILTWFSAPRSRR